MFSVRILSKKIINPISTQVKNEMFINTTKIKESITIKVNNAIIK